MNGAPAPDLARLADIHAAAQPALWPPAPGWWLLALLGLAGLALLVRAALRRLAVARRRRAWLRALEELAGQHDPQRDPQGYIAALNRLFRAVALNAFPGTACARLEGEAWVAFIAGLLPESADPGPLTALAHGPYEPRPDYDAAALRELAAVWVRRHG
ncbi:MAG: DUF4381 domain-containing protein [Xanthomonadales bacterium]